MMGQLRRAQVLVEDYLQSYTISSKKSQISHQQYRKALTKAADHGQKVDSQQLGQADRFVHVLGTRHVFLWELISE